MPTTDVLSVLQNALKENYSGTTYSTVVTRSEWLDLMKQNSKTHEGPEGKYFLLSDMIGAPEGIGARAEHDFLPVAGIPIFVNPRVSQKYNYAMIQSTWRAMKNAAQGPASFADWAEVTLTPAIKSLTDDMDRQCAGYGAAIVCRVDTTVTATTLGIDAPWGIAGDVKGWLPGIRRGRSLVFSPNADGSNLRAAGVAARVLSLDPAANGGGGLITVDAVPAGVADNDYIFFGDDYGTNIPAPGGATKEMMGIEGMIDDGTILDTLENLSRTTVPEWKSPQIDASAAPYSTNAPAILFMKMADDAELIGGGRVSHLVTSRSVFRNAFAQIQALGGFGATLQPGNGLSNGAKGITYYIGSRPVELRAVNRIIPGRCYAIDASTLHAFTLGAGEWDETAGGNMFRQVQSGMAVKDEYFCFYRIVRENATDNPRASCKSTGISETVA